MLTLLWLVSFIAPTRRLIARMILAPLHFPLRAARWMTAASAIGCFFVSAALSSQGIATEPTMPNQFAVILLGILIILVLAFFVLRFYGEVSSLRKRYSTIIDFDAELEAVRKRVEQAKREEQEFNSASERRRAKLDEEYKHALTTY